MQVGQNNEGYRTKVSDKLVLVLNGPNLNLLGKREPGIYGSATLADIGTMLTELGESLGLAVEMRQSNKEGELIDWLHEAQERGAHAVLLNAGAYTHTSIALLDAIRAIETPVIEVHLSNPHAREEFRHKSWIAPAAKGTIAGFGPQSYSLALRAAAEL